MMQVDRAAVEPAKEPTSWLQVIFSGGPIGIAIMIALIGLSMTAVYLAFDQLMTLRRSEVIPSGLAENVRSMLAAGRVREADAACRQKPSVLGFVILSGISELEFGWTAVEKAVEDALAEQSARLMRRVEYLSVIGNIAPMVGLLGTVFGMLLSFREVAISQGTAGAAGLADGIYQALVTTVAGLLIAIPALGVFALYRNRIDGMIAEISYLSQQVFTPLKRPQPRRTPAAATGTSSSSAGSQAAGNQAAGNQAAGNQAAGTQGGPSQASPSNPAQRPT
jgi:biopolymer transport protein ExbB